MDKMKLVDLVYQMRGLGSKLKFYLAKNYADIENKIKKFVTYHVVKKSSRKD